MALAPRCGLRAWRRTRPLITMHNTSSTVHISDWRKAVLVSPAETKVANSDMPTSTRAGRYQKVPRISRVSLRARRVRRRDSGWLRIRCAIGRRKPQDKQAGGQRRQHVGRGSRWCAPGARRGLSTRRGSIERFTKGGEAADQPQRRERPDAAGCTGRGGGAGHRASEKAITQIAEKQVPTTSA